MSRRSPSPARGANASERVRGADARWHGTVHRKMESKGKGRRRRPTDHVRIAEEHMRDGRSVYPLYTMYRR